MSEIDYGLPFREIIDHPLSLREVLAEVIASLRRQVLSQFVQDFLLALQEENYHFDQVIDALADFADTRPEWDTAVKRLEEAAEALLDVRKKRRQHPSGESAT